MTPILLISYFFPPIGMAGAARPFGLFRYLPDYGYRPYVLTVKDIIYPAHDMSMLTPEDERFISRTESLDPSRILYRLGCRKAHQPNQSGVMSRWATPDFKIGWRKFALAEAGRLIERHNIKLVVTTSPPPSIHQIGLSLKKRHHLKWVADFRDVWAPRPIEDAYTNQRQRNYAQNALADYREHADVIVGVNESIANYVGAEHVVANGADPSTFSAWESAAARTDNIFRIGYLGTTDTEQTLKPFIESLAEALRRTGKSAQDVKVVFVGKANASLLCELFAKQDMGESLELAGYLPRLEAVRHLAQVDALLVTLPDDRLAHITGSKIFDYLVSGKPIIALAPRESELGKLALLENESVFAEADVTSLTQKLKELIAHSANFPDVSHLTTSELKRRREEYSWATMAKRFAEVLDQSRSVSRGAT